MLNTFFWYVYRLPLPSVWCLIAFAVIGWALSMRLAAPGFPLAVKYVNCLLAAAALGGILYITVFRHASGEREIILASFYSFAEARVQKEMYRELLMNVFLFVPLGLSLPFALCSVKDGQWRPSLKTAVIAMAFAFSLSVGIEAVQYLFALGRCETDDVLTNTLGALLGVCAYLLQLPKKKQP